MSILGFIKKHKISSIIAASVVAVGVGGAAFAFTQMPSDKTAVSSTPVAQTIVESEEKTEAPVESTAQVEVAPTETAPVQEASTPSAPRQLSRDEVLALGIKARDAYTFNNTMLQKRAVYSAVLINYDKNPTLFTESNAESNINKCYAFLDTVAPETVSLNLSNGSCGL